MVKSRNISYNLPIITNREKLSMSLGIAIKGIDGIIMASDSRLVKTEENIPLMQFDGCKKLWKINEKVGLMASSNIGGYESWLIDFQLRDASIQDDDNFKLVIEKLSNLIKEKYYEPIQVLINTEIINIAFQDYVIDMIICGYFEKTPQIISLKCRPKDIIITPLNNTVSQGFIGVPCLAYYWSKKLYNVLPKLTIEQLKKYVVMLICETAKCYPSVVGGDIQMGVITQDGFKFVEYEETKEIEKYMEDTINTDNILRKLR